MTLSAYRCTAGIAVFGLCLASIAAIAAEGPVKDASRIVSIGGDVTEILYALKADPKIVAIDTTSTYPASALKEKQNVGYMRALSSEGVLSTNPSVIIAAADAGPAEVVSVLKTSSVPYVEVPDEPTPDGVAAKIRHIAAAIGAQAQGDALVETITRDFATVAAQRSQITKPVRVLFVLTVQNGRAIVAGRGTNADAVFTLAGAENAAADLTGYKPVADEAALSLAPEVIVTMKSGAPGHDPQAVLQLPAFKSTPAGKAGRLIVMDGNYLLNFGPRAGQATRELMRAFYPQLSQVPENAGQ